MGAIIIVAGIWVLGTGIFWLAVCIAAARPIPPVGDLGRT